MELVQDLNGGREGREMRGGALDAVGVSSFRSFESFRDKKMVSHDKMMRMRDASTLSDELGFVLGAGKLLLPSRILLISAS